MGTEKLGGRHSGGTITFQSNLCSLIKQLCTFLPAISSDECEDKGFEGTENEVGNIRLTQG